MSRKKETRREKVTAAKVKLWAETIAGVVLMGATVAHYVANTIKSIQANSPTIAAPVPQMPQVPKTPQ